MLAPDFAGLCPALLVTNECGLLRDEGERYAEHLAAGMPVVSERVPGMIHGAPRMAVTIDAGDV